MRMMNDNSKDEEIQVGNYLSYIPTESVHRPGHAQDMWSCAWTKMTMCVKWRVVHESVTVIMWSKIEFLTVMGWVQPELHGCTLHWQPFVWWVRMTICAMIRASRQEMWPSCRHSDCACLGTNGHMGWVILSVVPYMKVCSSQCGCHPSMKNGKGELQCTASAASFDVIQILPVGVSYIWVSFVQWLCLANNVIWSSEWIGIVVTRTMFVDSYTFGVHSFKPHKGQPILQKKRIGVLMVSSIHAIEGETVK